MNPDTAALVRASIRGVSSIFEGERGLRFSRLPEWTYPQHSHAPVVAKMAERLSGVHLNLLTSATRIEVYYRSQRDANLADGFLAGASTIAVTADGYEAHVAHTNGDLQVWNGDVVHETKLGEDSIASFELPAVGHARRVQIWLPHNCPIELLDISADAPLESDETESLPRWVHYGSSISHCEDADSPLGVWPVAAARELGLEIYNLGMGGCANLEQFSARTIRDLPADLISLKLGINVVNGANLTSRTFGPAAHGFIDTIRDKHATTPILVISPVCCPAHENNPGPSELGADGKVGGQEFSRHTWIGELTLCSIREILAELVEVRAKTDPNIYYLDGLQLFSEADAPSMPDGIHPDAGGYRVIAQNFVAKHPREWAANARG
ncbi:MAG: hypothetical protein RIR46_43 [Actinomycetota bacterium]